MKSGKLSSEGPTHVVESKKCENFGIIQYVRNKILLHFYLHQ